ncbi:MAG: tryptophan 7-halogenase [Bacteroidota bacterium]|nr:tryptophan 7-halogenase [Bacteroidota bacterium]
MENRSENHYDILIAGAGFAGSLTALILQKSGFKVGLLEKGQHPRFTIGESSTPVADMILRKLSSTYDLPWLYDFSRYGTWQQSHPEIVCGIKRGFSFFKHYPGEEFTTDENHKNELLVAASSSDIESDTNWLRADFDAFLVSKVKESGIDYFDLAEITTATRIGEWEFRVSRSDKNEVIYSSFFIDATGSGDLAGRLFEIESSSSGFFTNSFALFSHFDHVPLWKEMLKKFNIPINDFPYNPDHSALHQILDEGWLWMLRFNNDLTSLGFVIDDSEGAYDKLSTEEIWNDLLAKYPSIKTIFKDATLAKMPGKIIRSARLQRKLNHCFGEGWVALPHTVGFVDPLFSSGIAHTLSGVEKLVDSIKQFWGNDTLFYKSLQEYEHKVFEELKLADCLIAGCYKTMAHFELFNVWSMFYFAATIAHEQRRLKNKAPGYFLNADDPNIRKMVYNSYDDLLKIISSKAPSTEEIRDFTNLVKERIQPFNIAGLLDPASKNMYHHTVAVL